MKILITGASGFIGSALIPVFKQSGHEIVATSRRKNFKFKGVKIYSITDLGPYTKWEEILKGVEIVVHLAARVHVMNDKKNDPLNEYRRINSEGTRKLVMDSIKANVKQFIFLSTIKVNGGTNLIPFRSSDIPAPTDPYALSKLEAEETILEAAHSSKMRAYIIRPPLVYGPGVKGNFFKLLNICKKGWPLPIGSIDNRRSLIYVGNLVDMINLLIKKPPLSSGVYLCRDLEDISTPELVRKISAALDVKPTIIPFPLFLLKIAAIFFKKRATISRLSESLLIDDSQTRKDLNWTPPFSMIQGLRKTAAWLNNCNNNGKH